MVHPRSARPAASDGIRGCSALDVRECIQRFGDGYFEEREILRPEFAFKCVCVYVDGAVVCAVVKS